MLNPFDVSTNFLQTFNATIHLLNFEGVRMKIIPFTAK